MTRVEFLFDFGSPNCYLVHAVLPAFEKRTGASVAYVPVLLGGIFKATNNRSPVEAFRDVRNKLEYERLETERFVRRHGIQRYRWNPHFPVNTLALMRGAIAAQENGELAKYADAVFAAMWEDGKKMGDPEVFMAVLQGAGLDAPRYAARIQEPGVKEGLIRNTEQSVARGAFGAPTFFVGDDMYFGKERLRDIEDALGEAKGLPRFLRK